MLSSPSTAVVGKTASVNAATTTTTASTASTSCCPHCNKSPNHLTADIRPPGGTVAAAGRIVGAANGINLIQRAHSIGSSPKLCLQPKQHHRFTLPSPLKRNRFVFPLYLLCCAPGVQFQHFRFDMSHAVTYIPRTSYLIILPDF